MPAACIIGARRNSKRLPGKNKLPLNARPLYFYTVDAALESNQFKQVIFSTDDPDILAGLEGVKGLIVDARPPELCGDDVVMWDVGEYLQQKYAAEIGGADDLCFLTPCHPFRSAVHLQEAFKEYRRTGAAALVSVTQYPFPLELAIELEDGLVRRSWTGRANTSAYARRYYPNGAIMIVQRDFFAAHKSFYAPETAGFVMEMPDCLDIDYEEDYRYAQRIAGAILG